jgi:hypothetical protein
VPSRWSPGDRLALVEHFQARAGADSESFFDAHGLGVAYRKAGDNSSKRAKINAALHAAEIRGDVDDVLDAASRYLGGSPRVSEPEQRAVGEGVPNVEPEPRIFLSHASADRELADLLRNTLILGGVPEDRIFYSSARATGIPSGQDVGTYLRTSLRESGLVIELLSETFLTRPMCLMELGGAWTLGTPTYPIVVPPLSRDAASGEIGNVQMGILGTDAEVDSVFDELHDRLARDVGIQVKVAAWNRAIREFKQQFPSRLASARAAAVTTPPAARPGGPAASADPEVIAISNAAVVDGAFGRELHGEATNNDTVPHSAIVKATFYGPDGGIVGTADGVVNQLRPGGTKTISLQGVPGHARFKVEVDTLL